ncbi:hypothetical protein FAM19020_001427 [Propionibacterium freudenreichii]|uniref:hypothetical protein n=1 Tax=Propionibacterium freudenreichii TaxID=1744 RepID=UPI00254B42BE|nr:hypothetical protein [Propionibacterium freudenreichii]MDK9349084.1 hypothetical protein [Propionibacterium freudenreichii]MDK9653336.1 hypothetical protein [Propionibacterium freudenreichii]
MPAVSSRPEDSDPNYTLNREEPDKLTWLTADELPALDWATPDLPAVGQLNSKYALELSAPVLN